ncbi:hypothetical protein ACLBX9_12790 [Methylobacterium sp. A49B]
MATHAHSTRTPLLRLSGSPQPLLGQGLGRQPGPVTIALAAMQAADPDRQRIRELRRRIADRIEADLALLDALDGDPDSEPSLGAPEPVIGSGFGLGPRVLTDQERWAEGSADDREQDAGDEREEENEHGGDIQDEPHDPQPDDVLPRMHRWDPQVADGARKARRQAEAMRARKDRGARL